MAKSFLDEWLDDRASARFNLGESGVANVRLADIFRGGTLESELSGVNFDHNPTLGSQALRGAIAAIHDHSEIENVLVTAGASEAIFLYFLARREFGANVVVLTPAFHSLYDVPNTLGFEVRRIELADEEGYALPVERILGAVDSRTRCIVITTPSNPMGSVVGYDELIGLAAELERFDCDILLDEQYRLLPHEDNVIRFASAANRSPRVFSVGSAGKCYGAVGLRVGWIVGDAEFLQELNALKALTSHAISKLNDRICLELLTSGNDLLNANRSAVRRNVAKFEQLLAAHADRLQWVRPSGGTVAFPKLLEDDSVGFAQKLYERHDVLVLPGEAFDRPGHFRIRIGADPRNFSEAMTLMDQFLNE
ncbi:MAG: pyridoxal phosphate-dependent aminotransferase [Pseudomonadota bacterium]